MINYPNMTTSDRMVNALDVVRDSVKGFDWLTEGSYEQAVAIVRMNADWAALIRNAEEVIAQHAALARDEMEQDAANKGRTLNGRILESWERMPTADEVSRFGPDFDPSYDCSHCGKRGGH